MTNEYRVNLQSVEGKNPPSWAIGEQKHHSWYYENEHGEQWVAKREKDLLRIAGLDIGWTEIVLTLEQAEAENARISELQFLRSLAGNPDLKSLGSAYLESAASRQAPLKNLPLAKWILNEGEMLWISAVLSAVIPIMQWEHKKDKN
jgi:hypothetical protein